MKSGDDVSLTAPLRSTEGDGHTWTIKVALRWYSVRSDGWPDVRVDSLSAKGTRERQMPSLSASIMTFSRVIKLG